MVDPSSIIFTVSILLFHKYVGNNVAVINCTSPFYMFVPIKSDMKLANVNMVHAQGMGIILYLCTNCTIIYPVVPV